MNKPTNEPMNEPATSEQTADATVALIEYFPNDDNRGFSGPKLRMFKRECEILREYGITKADEEALRHANTFSMICKVDRVRMSDYVCMGDHDRMVVCFDRMVSVLSVISRLLFAYEDSEELRFYAQGFPKAVLETIYEPSYGHGEVCFERVEVQEDKAKDLQEDLIQRCLSLTVSERYYGMNGGVISHVHALYPTPVKSAGKR